MARPIGSGTISSGLLDVPVQLHAGERSVDPLAAQHGGDPDPDDNAADVPVSTEGLQPDFMALLKQGIAARGRSQKPGRASRRPTRRRSTYPSPAKRPTATGKRKR